MTTHIQTVEDWFPILNWPELPNFGYVHTLVDYNELVKNYLVTTELQRILDNLLIGLRGEHQLLSLRIMGAPGGGKTTFLYFIKRVLDTDPQRVRGASFHMHIAHIQAFIHGGEVDEDLILEDIQQAWTEFFYANELSEVAEDFNGQTGSRKRKTRKFTQFYKDNKKRFKKILIYVLDDVDNANDEQVLNAARHLYHHLEVASVKKWLSIREVTYNTKYNVQTRDYLQNFYPDRLPFPPIPLYDIIDLRVKNLQANAQNPFSKRLCHIVQNLHAGHLRQSLATLQNIITDILPKEFKDYSDISVIHNYIEKSSYGTFFKYGVLPNIHDPMYRSFKDLPIPMELLLLLKHTSRTDELLYGALNDVISGKMEAIPSMKHTEIRITTTDFKHSLKFLVDHQLIEEVGKGRHILTSKGLMLSAIVDAPYFIGLCEKALNSPPDLKLYWSVVKKRVDYKFIVLNKLDWHRE